MAKKASKKSPSASSGSSRSKKPKRVNAHLSEDFLAEMESELLKRRKALQHNISSELEDMREGSEAHHLADMEDFGGDASDEETSYKILEIESQELQQIDRALERIEDGTYGICEDSERPINMDRLRALPFATLCIESQREREREENR
jgi:RNA polymerase-binding transcription factor